MQYRLRRVDWVPRRPAARTSRVFNSLVLFIALVLISIPIVNVLSLIELPELFWAEVWRNFRIALRHAFFGV